MTSFKTAAIATGLLLVAGMMALPAYAGGQNDTDHHDSESHDNDNAKHVSALNELRALHAWTNATRDRDVHVYVELENTGTEAIMLTGAHADMAQTAQLTGFRLVNGEPQHEPIEAMPLDPSSTLMLSPNGLSIMLGGLSRALEEGEHFELYLDTDAGTLELHVEVESANARQHGHAGHSH